MPSYEKNSSSEPISIQVETPLSFFLEIQNHDYWSLVRFRSMCVCVHIKNYVKKHNCFDALLVSKLCFFIFSTKFNIHNIKHSLLFYKALCLFQLFFLYVLCPANWLRLRRLISTEWWLTFLTLKFVLKFELKKDEDHISIFILATN